MLKNSVCEQYLSWWNEWISKIAPCHIPVEATTLKSVGDAQALAYRERAERLLRGLNNQHRSPFANPALNPRRSITNG